MVKKILVVVLPLLILYLFFNSSDEEKEIRATLSRLVEIVSVSEAPHPIQVLSQAKDISQFLYVPLRFSASDERFVQREITDRKMLRQKIAQGFRQLHSLEASYKIKAIDIEKETAHLTAKVDVLASLKGREDRFYESHIVALSIRKIDGEWQIENVQQLENLRTVSED
jgi:hypothetical protein